MSPSLYLVEVLQCVLVAHVGGADVQLEVRTKVLKVIVVWQLCVWGEGGGEECEGGGCDMCAT